LTFPAGCAYIPPAANQKDEDRTIIASSTIITFRAHGDTLERLAIEAHTFDEATLQMPQGVYTSFRLYPGRRMIRLARHLDRLVHSGDMLGTALSVTPGDLRAMLRRAVEESGIDVPVVRVTIPFDSPDVALFALTPFVPPPEPLYTEGAHVITVALQRRLPRAKDSRFVAARREALHALLNGAYEGILRSPGGELLEGSSSNFYAVLDGVLRTAGEGIVLAGVARSLLLDVAPDVLPVDFAPVRMADLPRLTEAMITSSSRGVMPVVRIDDVTIGAGIPGPVYHQLAGRYQARLESELEPL
jgi:branched-chain amino acid aminotransferase